MAQWYTKEFGKLTGVSVRTLHYYDKIDLLKPSIRLPNGYRLYSEGDLLRQQQIIALKSFGFQLSKIKTLLVEEVDLMDHFVWQSEYLKEKAETILAARETLGRVISDYKTNRSIDWKSIIKLIEGYQMIKELEKTWAGKVFNPEQLKAYANFKEALKTRFTPFEHEAFDRRWGELMCEIDSNLDKEPRSKFGIAIGERCMKIVNTIYGKHQIAKRLTWEKGFKRGKIDDEHALSSEVISWFDRAIEAYYWDRAYTILKQVGIDSDASLLGFWNTLIDEICGPDQQKMEELVKEVMNDANVSREAKEWIKTHR